MSPDNTNNALRINGVATGDGIDEDATDQLSMEESGRDLENFKLQQEVQPSVTAARKREFKQIIVKCVLQLLMIETVSELLASDEVYEAMPSEQLLVLMQVLGKSYRFAQKFNNDRELRMNLLRIGMSLSLLPLTDRIYETTSEPSKAGVKCCRHVYQYSLTYV
jgi:brefeldin A-inhibited guanine nucleotide-exchange protein